MFSLCHLQASYKALLLIDSSSACIQVGLWQSGQTASGRWKKAVGDAGVAVFQATESLLKENGTSLSQIDAFAFCDGPGSVLGIRTAAVALRTWNVLQTRPMFAFTSLAVVAAGLAKTRPGSAFSVIADARRESWHRVRVDQQGAASSLERISTDQLQGPLVMPEGFRAWAIPPAGLERLHYNLDQWFAELGDVPLFRETDNPDAFLHEEPAYQTWTPHVHQAPQ